MRSFERFATSLEDSLMLDTKMSFFSEKQLLPPKKFVLYNIGFFCLANPKALDLPCRIKLEIGQKLYGEFFGFKDFAISLIGDVPVLLTYNQYFSINVEMLCNIDMRYVITCVLSGKIERAVC